MTILDKVLFMVVGTACFMAILFTLAALVGWVKADASLLVAAIFGPMVTIAAAILGVYGIGGRAVLGESQDKKTRDGDLEGDPER